MRYYSLNVFSICLLCVLMLACDKRLSKNETPAASPSREATPAGNEGEAENYIVSAEDRTWDTIAYETLRANLPPFDFNQDLSGKTLEELRILRNTIPARHGFLFMSSDLRHYFENTSWYKGLMEARWYGDCEYSGLPKAPPIQYTAEENSFLEKIKKLEAEKREQNFIVRNGKKYANVNNIVNAWQFDGLPDALKQGLDRNGFAIVPGQHVQLFHVYEQNDYSQTQNFVSTDLYLQLFHMHFSFMLRGLEENEFVPILKALTRGMADASAQLAKSTDNKVKDAAGFTSAFFAIPLSLLGEQTVVPADFKRVVTAELAQIEAETANVSALLPAYKENEFPYDMFKPRGHYTRTDALKMYFRAMQWLQLAPYCIDDDRDLERAALAALVLNTHTSGDGRSLKNLYKAILEPTSFIIGQPDNVSLLDLCEILSRKNVSKPEQLFANGNLAFFRQELKKIEASKNVIKPKIELTCKSKINVMPARFVLDNEILQEMTHLDKRPYPQGLDVLAAFGSKAAENILVPGEQSKWSEFLPSLEKMKAKYSNYEAWDETVYAKWIHSLNEMLKPDERYPSFMQLPTWNKKNLNTALASWAELKHDAVLYAEQPMAAECGDGGECSPPPEPYVIGYVEPNVNYWADALELLNLTEQTLVRHNIFSDDIKYKQERLKDMCQFLLEASKKELKGEELSEQEYRTIEVIGSTVEYITLSIFGTDTWDRISGPDKQVAVVADVYTNNQGEKAGILHAAVGHVNDLYVVVEIGGYLYLTKGATFSYYEFPQPLNKRLTDEEWQEALKQGKVYPIPSWMNEVIIRLDKKVEPKIQHLYSSGC